MPFVWAINSVRWIEPLTKRLYQLKVKLRFGDARMPPTWRLPSQ